MGQRQYSADGTYYIDMETGEKVMTSKAPSLLKSKKSRTATSDPILAEGTYTTTTNPTSGDYGDLTTTPTGESTTNIGGDSDSSSNFDLALPTRTTTADAYKTLQTSGILPSYSAVDYTAPTATLATDQLGDDYYNSLEQQATKNLQDKYFNNSDSIEKMLTNKMNRRGLIGSGIESGATTDLYKNYGNDLVSQESNLLQQKLQSKQALESQNAETKNQFAMQNAAQQLAAEQKNRDYQGYLSELGLRTAADDAKTATDFDTKIFDSQVNLMDKQSQYQNTFLEQLNSLLGNNNIDKTTRGLLRDILLQNGFGTDDNTLMDYGIIPDTRTTQTYGG